MIVEPGDSPEQVMHTRARARSERERESELGQACWGVITAVSFVPAVPLGDLQQAGGF